ncbi:MAG TPA: DinB family protein [Blastocatellia bacterium]|nr:DinB family protein [Blastocatellia bacterium]
MTGLLLSKILEQYELLQGLVQQIPQDKLNWRPVQNSLSLGELLGHLLECFAGFCAALYTARPDALADFVELKTLTVNHICTPDEAGPRLAQYMSAISRGFEVLTEDDLRRSIPTVFEPRGEPLFTILLGNLEHLVNHKHQLFFCLKLCGVDVGTRDLYKLRGGS